MDILLKNYGDNLVLGEDVVIVSDPQKIKQTPALIILSDNASLQTVKQPVDGLVRIEYDDKPDSLKYPRGGLTQTIAKQMAEDKKAYFVAYSDIKNAGDKIRLIRRVLHNIKVAKKIGVPVIFVTLSDKQENLIDVHSFFKAIGVPNDIVDKSQKELINLVDKARLRASDKYIAEGIRYV